MAAILRDSATVVVIFVRTHPQAILLAMITILYFPIPHNALCLLPKFCINYSEMLLGGLHIPKSI